MSRLIIIPDVHGMADELEQLLDKVQVVPGVDRVVSLGDITDKGPDAVRAARLLMSVNAQLTASNHDDRYAQFWRKGKRDASEVAVNSKNKETIQRQYAKLLEAPDVLEWLATKRAFIQTEIGGRTITMLHAGVTPHTDLYNLSGKQYNEIIRVRYIDKDTHDMVGLVNTNEGYPDESPNWLPKHNNVMYWQDIYDGRYGTIVHGHNVVPYPIIWQDEQAIPGTSYTIKNSLHHKSSNIAFWDVVSIDTGAYKGQTLSALVISEDGRFYIPQVKSSKSFSD